MVLSIPQPTLKPPREATRETWHYFKCNFTSTKAAAAARKRAHWILFINKVIHKWWDLSSVCERGCRWGVKDGGERQPPCIPLRSEGLQTDAERVLLRGGGQRDWALALGAAEPVCGCLKWADQSSHWVLLHSVEWVDREKTHRDTVPLEGFLSAWMTEAFPAAAVAE